MISEAIKKWGKSEERGKVYILCQPMNIRIGTTKKYNCHATLDNSPQAVLTFRCQFIKFPNDAMMIIQIMKALM